jgi:putative hydrolase of the HAD superfamily
MNFIFDIGNVLLDFKPNIFLKNLFNDRAVEAKMLEVVYKSQEWVKLDEGRITHKEARDIFFAREPDYHREIQHVMDRLTDMLTPIEETITLLPIVKSSGHSIYFLSNYHKELIEYILSKYDFFNLFDGGVFSCDVHMKKPSPGIYRYFLEKYSLRPESCVFFDDMEENVEAALKEGIHGVLFTDAGCVLPYL